MDSRVLRTWESSATSELSWEEMACVKTTRNGAKEA